MAGWILGEIRRRRRPSLIVVDLTTVIRELIAEGWQITGEGLADHRFSGVRAWPR